MSYNPIEFLGLKCRTNDAKFYICGSDSANPGGTFLGCCTTDPCSNNKCPAGDLRAAGYDPAAHDYIKAQKCDDDLAAWYTCASGATFFGCCQDNACQGDGRCNNETTLRAALMSDERVNQAAFFVQPAATTDPAATSTGANTPAKTNDGDEGGGGGNNNTAVHAAVGAVCGVVGLLLIAGAIVFFLRRRRRQNAPPVDLPPAWRSDNAHDHPMPPPSTSAMSPTIAPSSPFLPDGSPTTPHAQALLHHQHLQQQQDKNGAVYPSGVSSLSSQGYNPAHGIATSPSASPYSTPYASPAPHQTEFAHRQSTYSQGYGMPVSPSPTQQTFVGHNTYQGPQSFAAELPASEADRR